MELYEAVYWLLSQLFFCLVRILNVTNRLLQLHVSTPWQSCIGSPPHTPHARWYCERLKKKNEFEVSVLSLEARDWAM